MFRRFDVSKCRTGSGEACSQDGEFFLVAPGGDVSPGGAMCRAHAEDCIREYLDKLGERWKAVSERTGQIILASNARRIAHPARKIDLLLELAKLGL
jgi:hypothetical protein